MIELLPESKGAIVGLDVTGRIASEEEQRWINKIQAMIDQYGKLSFLIVYHPDAHFTAAAMYEDLKWTLGHLKNINKIAIVSDSKLIKLLVHADSPFARMLHIKERYFNNAELTDAWKWIKQCEE
ncbi:STAS/SEC14 domain-containing protein [uncultured Endozoicomonas sp.]|uniref:STAS/SEC14 domain-containing protein n=1 Tax=uncultured Endozoicomonas sp. TaxID=432652 RepID=UPI002638DEA4|nr:STAS/SEC14 domain-containing protein [uncultured Endozoicomonas sp.]